MAQQTISKMETVQTAVEWLENELHNFIHPEHGKDFLPILEQAKQMENEQIMKAFSDGQETPLNHPTLPHYSREEYYNETYNKQKLNE